MAAPASSPVPRVLTGIDCELAAGLSSLRGQRVGLLTNPSGVTANLLPTRRVLQDHSACHLAALFSPEHGIDAVVDDAQAVPNATYGPTRIPVYSLYGQTVRPTADMLRNLDVIAVDIQDVGARFYTYIWTLSHVLEAAAAADLPVIVFDRPNPIDGVHIAGPSLSPGYASFLGRWPIPLRHGMTIGELARWMNARLNPAANLHIVPMSGWRRDMTWPETGLAWVPPSPGLPTFDAARIYPGTCLVEGTNLSEGRGTPLPFQMIGAPWVDPDTLADALNQAGLPGVCFRPAHFTPLAGKWQGQVCGGVHIHAVEPGAFEPLEVGLTLIATVNRLWPRQFAWLPSSWEGAHPHFDLLMGNSWARAMLEEGRPVDKIVARAWSEAEPFACERQPFLLYD
ncbi:MAG: exo-beta-N-acetylmuramidase NamZ family protein [Candidatus Roseilinea sp.]|uniref:exo-beta-N-acetylmuramidase NamZ family protein n=1 Tax=Candidatus Roseilinea sp. TaxID=2838777 RepID=UPI00404B6A67